MSFFHFFQFYNCFLFYLIFLFFNFFILTFFYFHIFNFSLWQLWTIIELDDIRVILFQMLHWYPYFMFPELIMMQKFFRLRLKILHLKIYILGEITGLWGTINFNWMKLIFLQKIMWKIREKLFLYV